MYKRHAPVKVEDNQLAFYWRERHSSGNWCPSRYSRYGGQWGNDSSIARAPAHFGQQTQPRTLYHYHVRRPMRGVRMLSALGSANIRVAPTRRSVIKGLRASDQFAQMAGSPLLQPQLTRSCLRSTEPHYANGRVLLRRHPSAKHPDEGLLPGKPKHQLTPLSPQPQLL